LLGRFGGEASERAVERLGQGAPDEKDVRQRPQRAALRQLVVEPELDPRPPVLGPCERR